MQAKKVAKLITTAKRTYYQRLISECAKKPKKLWSTLQSLLSLNSPSPLPASISSSTLATSFLTFFNDKILRLCSSFVPLVSNTSSSPHIPPTSTPPPFSEFSLASPDEVRKAVLVSSNSTCSLDIIPTFLLKSCLDSLILPITNIINLALSEGNFPAIYKNAIVRPLLKKHNLPHNDLSSYRPISNLNFISKILERIILTRINVHRSSNLSLSLSFSVGLS